MKDANPMRKWAYGEIALSDPPKDRLAASLQTASGTLVTAAPPDAFARPLLEIRRLHHRFAPGGRRVRGDGVPVLEDINLRVERGEIVVLVGPSGCGKSTLLNLASGLNASQRGEIAIQGQGIRGPDPRLGHVFQQPALLPWLTVRGNVEFGLTLRHSERLSARQRKERIQRTLRLVGLEIDPETATAHLSGGMAQRVALARVLVRNPCLLLLDEPFSALDAVTRSAMQNLLLRIVNQTGMGILMVTHDVDEAIQLGDRILLMRTRPGTIERQWSCGRGQSEHGQSALKRDVLDALTTILQSRRP